MLTLRIGWLQRSRTMPCNTITGPGTTKSWIQRFFLHWDRTSSKSSSFKNCACPQQNLGYNDFISSPCSLISSLRSLLFLLSLTPSLLPFLTFSPHCKSLLQRFLALPVPPSVPQHNFELHRWFAIKVAVLEEEDESGTGVGGEKSREEGESSEKRERERARKGRECEGKGKGGSEEGRIREGARKGSERG